eukprot:5882590-Amphidinium_carterae.1
MHAELHGADPLGGLPRQLPSRPTYDSRTRTLCLQAAQFPTERTDKTTIWMRNMLIFVPFHGPRECQYGEQVREVLTLRSTPSVCQERAVSKQCQHALALNSYHCVLYYIGGTDKEIVCTWACIHVVDKIHLSGKNRLRGESNTGPSERAVVL